MIIVDTAIWIDHFRSPDAVLIRLLEAERVLLHPFVLGEIAMGSLRERRTTLSVIADLPRAEKATDDEVFFFIEDAKLFSSGIGFIDAHLLASARLKGTKIWSHDRRLSAAAQRLGVNYNDA